MGSKTLLVVDDEKRMMQAIKRILRREDYTIHCISSPIEALDVIEEIKPHVVLSDRRMPHMDGLDFLTRVKERYPQCYCILMTGYPHVPASVENAIKKGAIDSFVQKTVSDDALADEIEKAFQTNMKKQ